MQLRTSSVSITKPPNRLFGQRGPRTFWKRSVIVKPLLRHHTRSDQYTPEAIELVNSEIKRRKLDVDCVVEQASKIKTEDAHLKTKEEKESSDTFWYLLDGAILVTLWKSFGVVSALIIGTPAIFAVQTLKVIVGKDRKLKPSRRMRVVLCLVFVILVLVVLFMVDLFAKLQHQAAGK
jgi:hypothetical protein